MPKWAAITPNSATKANPTEKPSYCKAMPIATIPGNMLCGKAMERALCSHVATVFMTTNRDL